MGYCQHHPLFFLIQVGRIQVPRRQGEGLQRHKYTTGAQQKLRASSLTIGNHDTTCPPCVSLQLAAVACDFPSPHDHPRWKHSPPNRKENWPREAKGKESHCSDSRRAPARIRLAPTLADPLLQRRLGTPRGLSPCWEGPWPQGEPESFSSQGRAPRRAFFSVQNGLISKCHSISFV